MERLYVGVGREDICPKIGTKMGGYAPARPALSIHDPIHATAFVFSYGQTRALLLSAELCNIGEEVLPGIQNALEDATGIPAAHTVVATTHTHSAPRAFPAPDEPFTYVDEIFIPAAVKAAKTACENLRPAQLGIGTTMSDVAINRRRIKEDGKVALSQNPYGPYDPEMSVLSFREPDGTPIGNLIHYGCHNTASGQNDAVTRDWCGVAIDRLEELSGGITAFINGCGGDCGPRLPNGRTTGTVAMAQELGGRAAIDAVRAWKSIKQWQEVDLNVLEAEIKLPLQDVGTPEQVLAEAKAMGDPSNFIGMQVANYETLLERAAWLQAGNVPPKHRCISHTAIALGPVVLLAMPFEPFAIITLRVKEASPYPYTLCVGYANGALSYFPSMDQIIRGGYEIDMFRNINLIPFSDDSEQHYVAGCLAMIRALHG